MEASTSLPLSTPSATTIYWHANLWHLTWTSDEIFGLIVLDGHGSYASILIPQRRHASLTGQQILVLGRGSVGLLRRCLALACGVRPRSTDGATACSDSPTEG